VVKAPTAAEAVKAEALAAFVAREMPGVLGVEAARLKGLLWGVERGALSWLSTPWTDEEIARWREHQGHASKGRAAFDAVIAALTGELAFEHHLTLDRAAEIHGLIAALRLFLEGPLLSESLLSLALGHTGHKVKPWSVDARLIADEILKARQELDRRAGYRASERLDDEEIGKAASFIHKLFLRFGDASRHGELPSRRTIWWALKNPPR
jgi:hypothetical protein